MNTFQLSGKSEIKLQGVHPDLIKVVRRALQISELDFAVIDGVRTSSRQMELVAAGASRTMRSRHLTGHAVDLAPIISGIISWAWPPFYILAAAMKHAASELGIPIVWGGDWASFPDGPHFELDRLAYPA